MNNPNPLTREKFAQMVAAVQSIGVNANKKIRTPNEDAEIAGQKQFLSRAFSEHSGELLQCWLLVADEYTPLVRAFSALQQRAAEHTAQRDAHIRALIESAQQSPAEGTAVAKESPAPADDPNIIVPDFAAKTKE